MNDELSMFESNNPFYAFKHLLIKLNHKLSDIMGQTPESAIYYSQFIHEYTHYLQSFSTVNGICAMISYFEAIENILEKLPKRIINQNNNLKELIDTEKSKFNLCKNRLYWEAESFYKADLTLKYEVENMLNPVFKKNNNEIFIKNILDGKLYHVSTKVLRENMSQMVTYMIQNIGDDAIMTNVELNKTPYHYWLLFSYFLFEYPKIEDKRIFTYYFCELVLSTQNTGETMNILLKEFDYEYYKGDYENCYQILDKLRINHHSELLEILSHLEYLINNISNKFFIKSQYGQFYSIFNKYLRLLLKGTHYRKTHTTIFNAQEIISGVWVNEMTNIFLSPLIRQPENEFRILFDDQNFVDEMYIFFAVTIIIEKYLNNESITVCPFHTEIPICDEFKKSTNIENICLIDPFQIKKFENGGCAFYNACLFLGVLPQEELNKYIYRTPKLPN